MTDTEASNAFLSTSRAQCGFNNESLSSKRLSTRKQLFSSSNQEDSASTYQIISSATTNEAYPDQTYCSALGSLQKIAWSAEKPSDTKEELTLKKPAERNLKSASVHNKLSTRSLPCDFLIEQPRRDSPRRWTLRNALMESYLNRQKSATAKTAVKKLRSGFQRSISHSIEMMTRKSTHSMQPSSSASRLQGDNTSILTRFL